MTRNRAIIGVAAATGALWASPARSQDGDRLLAEVGLQGTAGCPAVLLRFHAPVRYLGTAGTDPLEPRLLIEPLPPSTFVARDSVALPKPAGPIRAIRWDRDASEGPTLALTLGSPTEMSVALGNDAQSIVIQFADSASSCDATGSDQPSDSTELEPIQAEQLLASAEDAIASGDFAAAESALLELLQASPHAKTQRAMELRGLVHERLGRTRQARAIYEDYLRRDPDDDDNGARIAARLADLPRDRMEVAAERDAAEQRRRLSVTGSVAQFYQRDGSRNVFVDARRPVRLEEIDERVNIDQSLSSADVTLAVNDDRTRVSFRAAGSHTSDFRPVTLVGASRSSGDDTTRLYALNLDIRDEPSGLSARFGRQTLYGSGVFGRFDGLHSRWKATSSFEVGLQAGYPVSSSRLDYRDNDRWFYGASVDFAPDGSRYRLGAYWYDQYSQGVADRRSMGLQGRYTDGALTLFGVADFDVLFSKLSYFLASGTLSISEKSTFSLQVDQQYYPALTRTNARIGQGSTGLADLKRRFGRDLEQIAEDRSAKTWSVAAALNSSISDKWIGILDGVLTRTSAAPASAGVPAIPGTGIEFFGSATLVGSGVLKNSDTLILGARYADTAKFRILEGEVAARIPVATRLSVEPRLSFGLRMDKFGAGERAGWRAGMRTVYQINRATALDASIEHNWYGQRQDDAVFDGRNRERATTVNIGYRLSL